MYEAFVARLVPDTLTTYAAAVQGLRDRFAEVWVVDGSRLDAVAHRLKLTWDVRSPLLPGCLLVLYDLFRGFPRRLLFCADAARSELQHGGKPYTQNVSSEEKSLKEYAALLGRRGGVKGGKARAQRLSPERRKAIARKAAKARWARDRARKGNSSAGT